MLRRFYKEIVNKFVEEIIRLIVKNKKISKLNITFIILDILALGVIFLAYGPISYFRNLLVTTAMTTMSHHYLARTIYTDKMISYTLSNNYVSEGKQNTNTSDIIIDNEDDGNYESIYEEQILKRDPDNDLYKVIENVGTVCEFNELKAPQITARMKAIAKAYGVQIDDMTARYFMECCGTNMQNLINEIRKLIEFVGPKGEITKKDEYQIYQDLLEKNIIVEWFERCKHAFKFRIKKAELNKVQELLDDKYSEYNMSQKQLVKLNIIGYGIIQDNKVLMQTMNILKEHNVNILNVNLSQARIEIVADEIENSLVELLHKKLIKKGE